MGSNTIEKRTKKMKKIKKRGSELVDDGKSSRVANVSNYQPKDDSSEMNEDNVPVVQVKAQKSKKIRNSKKKVTPLPKEESSVVNDGEQNELAGVDHTKGKNDKSKKIRQSKKKATPLSNGESNVAKDEEKNELAGEDCSKGKMEKLNKVHKNKRKRAFVSDEQNTESSAEEETEPVIVGSKSKKDKSKRARKNKMKDTILPSEQNAVVNNIEEAQPELKSPSNGKKDKSKKAKKQKKASQPTITEEAKPIAKPIQDVKEVAVHDVYQISSAEDDDSKGMKKWIKEYHEKRPGIKVLQEQIDDFTTAYEEQEEQAKREKEANLAEDGWTVVVHRKGGKKTTDSESGVTVGGVSETAVLEKLAKKKTKDIGLDFYRHQRKEVHRSEIMKLQSKFEEDKRRIQQIRAARKFKPY